MNPFDDDDDDDVEQHSRTHIISPRSLPAVVTQSAYRQLPNNNTSTHSVFSNPFSPQQRPSTASPPGSTTRSPNGGGISRPQSSDRKAFNRAIRRADKRMEQAGVGHEVVCVNPDDENKVIRFFVSDRVYGYPGTDGTWFSNYKNYVRHNHPLFSLLCAHRLHPYSLRNRFVVFVCLVMFAVTLSFVFWNTDYVPQV
jgi:hypothetical protein